MATGYRLGLWDRSEEQVRRLRRYAVPTRREACSMWSHAPGRFTGAGGVTVEGARSRVAAMPGQVFGGSEPVNHEFYCC
jgi:hypothetical protein